MRENRDVFEIYNAGTVMIPPGGLCRPVGGFTDSGAIKVGPPTRDSQDGLIVCLDFGINPFSFGTGTLDNRVSVARLPESSGEPDVATDDTIGSVAGSYYGVRGNKGFTCVGGVAGYLVNAFRTPGDCCGDDGPNEPPGGCPPSIKLPCIYPNGSTGQPGVPCWFMTSNGVVYYDCNGGGGAGGGGGGTGGGGTAGGGVMIVCDGDEPVCIAGRIGVEARNGTRSFSGVTSVKETVSQSGGVWPINIQQSGVGISGYLTFCCNAKKRGLYFVGSVYSIHADPNGSGGSPGFWCGCARQFNACPPCSQTIISGPTFDPCPASSAVNLAQVLRLDVGCGTVDLVIGPCSAITDWQGAGYYCVKGCVERSGWKGAGYYCVEGSSGGGSGGGEGPKESSGGSSGSVGGS